MTQNFDGGNFDTFQPDRERRQIFKVLWCLQAHGKGQ